MLDGLQLRCDEPSCERGLTPEQWRLSFATDGAVRRVYECRCGAITITLGRRP